MNAAPRLLVIAGLVTVVTAATETQGRSDKWWWDYGGGPSSAKFVNLDHIDKSNVGRLEVAWFYPHGTTGFNPIVVDDVMYVMGRNSALIALDATTGKEIWIHDGLVGMTSRGINYWQSEDGKDRRLIFSINGFLQAIDARTGKSIISFGKGGIIDMREGLRRAEGTERRVQSRTPGRVWKNLLIMGSASGEGWVTPPGDIRAYDVITGKRVWQFHTVPEPGEFGYETWPKDAYLYAGGANNWGEMAVDEERGIVYVPTGSATYDFYGGDRLGMNLFANCLLALDARTGKRLWHFQTTHHDLWDLDNTAAPQLTTVRHNGQRVDIVALAGKTGFLYVFNRVTGEPLWPIEERPMPKSDVPGEQAWPTQPIPTKPPPFAKLSFGVDDVNPWLLSPEEFATMRERVAKARNEGIYTPPALIDTISMPGNQGGSNWGTTAADPRNGIVYVVNVNQVAILKLEDVKTRPLGRGRSGVQNYQRSCQACHAADLQGVPGLRPPSLVGVVDRLGEEAIRAVVTGGKGTMRPVSGISEADLSSVIAYLANPGGRGGRGGRGGEPREPELPPGPIVATGGSPLPAAMAVNLDPPTYGTNGGNGGDVPYPEGVEVPRSRYVSEYGVMASATMPPYTTLTAYDLNTGTIKWQVAPGDDLATLARGGPANTGSVGGRYGMVATKSGLVFLAGGDGKVRAYDQDTGNVLWTAALPGTASGIPVSYESKGRQYFVLASQPGGFRGMGGGAPAISPDAPRGYIAFALPRTGRSTAPIPLAQAPSSSWRALYNGKDLTGFTTTGTASWKVEDGVIVGGQDGDFRKRGNLVTTAEFKDFELELEFQIDEHGKYNSGVHIRGGGGYQINIGRPPSGEFIGVGVQRGEPRQFVWLSKGDEKDTIRKPLQWNTLRILAKGAHFEITLNGVKTVDVTDPEPQPRWLEKGTLSFQTYGAEEHAGFVKFRNLRIREL